MTAMATDDGSNRIEEEASLWAARLRGRSLGEDERAALAVWLEADPEHRWILGRYRDLSVQLDAQWGAAEESVAVMQAGRWRRRRMTAALAGLAACAAAAWLAWERPSPSYATETAERHTAALADGSHVELNARTSLAVDFSRGERRVRLSRGEAFF
ncbi:MAG TPA: DUF4880 domain-containing protein, partial [Opitutaceae bacterium]|nr:DUF4880 domain-containing protein [Opitutaceae bacterium]